MAKAHSAVGAEASQKTQIIAEAENAIQRQRSEIINQAEHTMQEQCSLIKQRLSELAEEARTEKHALDLERQIRIHAQGDLQRVASQLFEEMGIRDAALGDQKRVHDELNSEQAVLGRTRQELQAAYQEGRLLYAKSEKQYQKITQLTADTITKCLPMTLV